MIVMQEAKDAANAAARLDGIRRAIRSKLLFTVNVEPSSKCNLNCSFCDMHSGRVDGVAPLKGIMSRETFRALIDQLGAVDFTLKELQYIGNGEPLLNKRLPEFIAYAREKKVAVRQRLTTNGTMMTPKNLKAVIAAGIDSIHVSLDTADWESYRDLKGKPLLENVLANIDHAIGHIESVDGCALFIKYGIPHVDGKYGFSDGDANSVIRRYQDRARHSKKIHLKAMPIVTVLDGKAERRRASNAPCELPFYSVSVKFDGNVSACCSDLLGDLRIGNINTTPLAELLRGEPLRNIRRCHLEARLADYPICLYCENRTVVDLQPVADELIPLL